jgi:putative sterol carrier protein
MDEITAFFERLPQERGGTPALAGTTATLRFDLVEPGGTDHWLVTLADGQVGVAHRKAKADCTLRMERAQFEDLISGRLNPMAATLRGIISVEGQPALLARLQRIIPGPPTSSHPRAATGGSPR